MIWIRKEVRVKRTDFDTSRRVEEYIVGLDVSMDDMLAM
jgi:hypothetical protein